MAEDVLTQAGGPKFPKKLRPLRGEKGLSLILGRSSVSEAVSLAFGRGVRKGETVRYTTVGRLRDAGFWPCRWPVPKNLHHVLVQFPGEWDDSVTRAFEGCFDETRE